MQVKLGSVVTELSGKLGGMYISKDRSGASLRIKRMGGEIKSQYVLATSAIQHFVQGQWRGLTQSQRNSWLAVHAHGYTGLQLYYRINFWLKYASRPLLTVPPASFIITPVPVIVMTALFGSSLITFTPVSHTLVPSRRMAIFLSPPVSAGKNHCSQFRLASRAQSDINTPFTVTYQTLTNFGALVKGKKLFAKIISYPFTSGFPSEYVIISCIIQ